MVKRAFFVSVFVLLASAAYAAQIQISIPDQAIDSFTEGENLRTPKQKADFVADYLTKLFWSDLEQIEGRKEYALYQLTVKQRVNALKNG